MRKYLLNIGSKEVEAKLLAKDNDSIRFSVADKEYQVSLRPVLDFAHNASGASPVVAPRPSAAPAQSGPGEVRAPMPGIITRIEIEPDQEIDVGDTLLVIEAMKMENNISATSAGKVSEICVQSGQEVEGNQLLIKIK